jgi:hypothetical protein
MAYFESKPAESVARPWLSPERDELDVVGTGAHGALIISTRKAQPDRLPLPR